MSHLNIKEVIKNSPSNQKVKNYILYDCKNLFKSNQLILQLFTMASYFINYDHTLRHKVEMHVSLKYLFNQ